MLLMNQKKFNSVVRLTFRILSQTPQLFPADSYSLQVNCLPKSPGSIFSWNGYGTVMARDSKR